MIFHCASLLLELNEITPDEKKEISATERKLIDEIAFRKRVVSHLLAHYKVGWCKGKLDES